MKKIDKLFNLIVKTPFKIFLIFISFLIIISFIRSFFTNKNTISITTKTQQSVSVSPKYSKTKNNYVSFDTFLQITQQKQSPLGEKTFFLTITKQSNCLDCSMFERDQKKYIDGYNSSPSFMPFYTYSAKNVDSHLYNTLEEKIKSQYEYRTWQNPTLKEVGTTVKMTFPITIVYINNDIYDIIYGYVKSFEYDEQTYKTFEKDVDIVIAEYSKTNNI